MARHHNRKRKAAESSGRKGAKKHGILSAERTSETLLRLNRGGDFGVMGDAADSVSVWLIAADLWKDISGANV